MVNDLSDMKKLIEKHKNESRVVIDEKTHTKRVKQFNAGKMTARQVKIVTDYFSVPKHLSPTGKIRKSGVTRLAFRLGCKRREVRNIVHYLRSKGILPQWNDGRRPQPNESVKKITGMMAQRFDNSFVKALEMRLARSEENIHELKTTMQEMTDIMTQLVKKVYK